MRKKKGPKLLILFAVLPGLRMAYKMFPEGLITGTMPAALIEELSGIKSLGKKSKPMPVEKVPADVTSFTQDHVDKLCEHLDGVLSDRSVGSKWSVIFILLIPEICNKIVIKSKYPYHLK